MARDFQERPAESQREQSVAAAGGIQQVRPRVGGVREAQQCQTQTLVQLRPKVSSSSSYWKHPAWLLLTFTLSAMSEAYQMLSESSPSFQHFNHRPPN